MGVVMNKLQSTVWLRSNFSADKLMNFVVEFAHGKDVTKGWTKTKGGKMTKPKKKKKEKRKEKEKKVATCNGVFQ